MCFGILKKHTGRGGVWPHDFYQHERDLMTNKAICALTVAVLAVAHPAEARHHKRQHSAVATGCVYTNGPVIKCFGQKYRTSEARIASDANGNRASVVGGRPAGCPYAFCGCEASLYLFGKIVPSLNLAANWIRKFPRAHPAPGMAAARQHHVMVLIRHISGSDWLVHDGNSGHHLTREHVRSIAGYVIVDPRSRTASND
jgi:hypothetical protein